MTKLEELVWAATYGAASASGTPDIAMYLGDLAVRKLREDIAEGVTCLPLDEGNIEVFTCETHGHDMSQQNSLVSRCARCGKTSEEIREGGG